jgi:hypothetical protein
MSSEQQASSIFPVTNWAELGKAAAGDEARLDQLIRLYMSPLRIFFVTTFPGLSHEADVYLQEFAEDRIIKQGWLQRADKNRGQFRHFLKTSLRHFVLDRLSRADVKHAPLSLDELDLDLPNEEAAADEFDLAWVRIVLAETMRRMEDSFRRPGDDQPRRSYIWEIFRVRLLDPILEDATVVPYEQLIERFGLRSPMEGSNMLLSAKRSFQSHLNDVIREYMVQDKAAALEVHALESFLARLAKR